jgi:DeoR/GlpR family transcriptional regulator of sugar metabolism
MRQATRDRQQRVMSELLDHKHVTVKELADAMAVSEATVRRDLRTLADSQQLSLVHGGATLSRQDFSFIAKHDRNLTAKRIIGYLAASLVKDGQQLFLDSGTTVFEMVPFLQRKQGLSIVLNSARLALELKGPETNIILLGGQFRAERMDTVGPIAMAELEQLRGFVTFVGADGLSMDMGPSAVDMESAHLYRLAVTNARETVLLADHTKFEGASLFRIVQWDQIDRVVTDRPPSAEWAAFFAGQEITVHHPDPAEFEKLSESAA